MATGRHDDESRPEKSEHTFHLPVMGTGFTIDTALRVAKYGISSVMALGDDILIEQMRKFHCEKTGELYEEISVKEDDYRARRITAYLNMIDRQVKKQVEELQASPFEPESEITRYYNMLPETDSKKLYRRMLAASDSEEKRNLQRRLRKLAVPGSIDVNIMTKINRTRYHDGRKLPQEAADALTALRGFASSTLHASIVFSAGMNMPLYSHVAKFDDFFPDENGTLKKKITLKVSDYRSAMIQGKMLAKRGLWISEFRIESGLNCGGHAFATKGYLLGPILEEFKQQRKELVDFLHSIYCKALSAAGRAMPANPHETRITVQGGIGTASENEFLLRHYEADSTGWATPFLLVPEVTNLDDENRKRLITATDKDVKLSDSSPLGIPFWNLQTSLSEENRRRRISEGKPGSPCPKEYLELYNTEFTEKPICVASRNYEKRKLNQLARENLPPEQLEAAKELVVAKSCLCVDLAATVTLQNGIEPESTPAVCSGPNIVNFARIATLEEMISHIYGRISLLAGKERPHMFIKELTLYMDYLRNEVEKSSKGIISNTEKYLDEFRENLINGIEYYRELSEQFVEEKKKKFLKELNSIRDAIGEVQRPKLETIS
ncbi:MAG: hypothetical protein ACE5EN_08700 [Nitrospinota bacterium]